MLNFQRRRFSSSFRKWSNATCTNPIGYLLICSPFEKQVPEVWFPLIKDILGNKHEIGLLNIFVDENENLAEKLYRINHAKNEIGPQTVLIAPSFSSFLAQKYLESFTAKGLFLINSFPKDIKSNMVSLHQQTTGKLKPDLSLTDIEGEFKYRGIFQGLFTQSETPFYFLPELLLGENFNKTLQQQLRYPGAELVFEMINSPVNLEKNSIPMHFTFSKDDKVLDKASSKALVSDHGFSWENNVESLDVQNHIFWFNNSSSVHALTDSVLRFGRSIL